jgi:hypothetical chaperone protein
VADPGGEARLATFPTRDGETETFRSILYFERDDAGGRLRSAAGPRAIEGYLDPQDDGRLVQSLKSFLASRLFSSTSVLGSSYRLESLIALILSELREGAERRFGPLGDRVVAGRPVRFANAQGPEDDALALQRLQAAFHNAGFGDVVFEYEPVAAAYFYESRLDHDELICIADFGGGTSDFSLLRVGPSRRRGAAAVLGTAGIALAGDCFDGEIVRHVVAPRLGMGASVRTPFGRTLRVPEWIYAHLQRWNHLSFLRSGRTLQILYDLRREAEEPERIAALLHLVEHDLGFQLYRSVQATKLALSNADSAAFEFRDGPVDIEQMVARAEFEGWIAGSVGEIEVCLDGLLAQCSVQPGDVDRVFRPR